MASSIYTNFKLQCLSKTMTLANNGGDTIKCALLLNPSFVDTNTVWSNVSSSEITSTTGYTAGGATLTNQGVATSTGSPYLAYWSASQVSWGTTSTITATHAILYDSTVSNNLIGFFDFGGTQTCTNGTFTINWSPSGILTIQ